MNLEELIRALTEKMQGAQASMAAILADMAADNRDEMTSDETAKMASLQANFSGWENQRGMHEATLAANATMNAPLARVTVSDDDAGEDDQPRAQASPASRATRRPVTGDQPIAQMRGPSMAQSPKAMARDGQRGFHSIGEFAQAVYAMDSGGRDDPRLRFMANSQNSLSGADGGHLVPPDFRDVIVERVLGADNLIARSDIIPSARGEVTFPRDGSQLWGTGGVKAYRAGQQTTLTGTKATFEPLSVKAHKAYSYVEVSEEMFEDAPALDGHLKKRMPQAIDWLITNEMYNGTGVGQCLGFMNGGGLVTVAKETAQTAATVNATNVAKMWARMPASSRMSAVWLISPSVEDQLQVMTIGDKPVYLPPGGMANAPFGALMGRPIIPHQVCETAGTVGDIVFVDPQQYLTCVKTGNGRMSDGTKFDMSMHFKFDTDEIAYKLTMRIGGAPWWDSAIPAAKGSFDTSPYVALATRA